MQDARLEEMRMHTILKPECTVVHEDFRILKQRRRWVSFRPNTNYFSIDCHIHLAPRNLDIPM